MEKRIIFFVLVLVFSITARAQWSYVGSAGFSGGNSTQHSLKIDGNGTPYVAYADGANSNKATVMKFDGVNWVTIGSTGFSSGAANDISIAIDSNNVPYVAFSDNGNGGKISVVKLDTGSWVNLGASGFSTSSVSYVSLAINNSDELYVSYSDTANGSKATVMKFNGTTWESVGSVGFSSGQTYYNTLAIDNNGIPYVAMRDSGSGDGISLYKFNGSSWEHNSLLASGNNTGYHTLAIDNTNAPYVAYNTDNYGASVVKYNGVTWETIGSNYFSGGNSDAWFTTLAIDNNDRLYIGYQDWSAGNGSKSSVMTFNGSSWEYVGLSGFSAGASYHQSLAIDNSNNLFISYQDMGNSGKVSVMKYSGAVLSVDENNFGANFTIYPNPSCGISSIQLGESFNEIVVEIYNSIGNLTESINYQNISNFELDTQNYQSGVYLVHIQSGNKKAIIKMMVK